MLAAVCAVPLFLGGCSLHDLQNVTAGESTKRELLAKNVDSYHRALYWGSLDEAATFMLPDARASVMSRARNVRDRERLVSMNVDDVQLDDEGKEATVLVTVKYFRNGSYVVESRREKEIWDFAPLGGGWRLAESEVTEAGRVADAGLLR